MRKVFVLPMGTPEGALVLYAATWLHLPLPAYRRLNPWLLYATRATPFKTAMPTLTPFKHKNHVRCEAGTSLGPVAAYL